MKSRHGQWLIVIKRNADSSTPLAQKAATRHKPRPLTAQNPEQPGIDPDRYQPKTPPNDRQNPKPVHRRERNHLRTSF